MARVSMYRELKDRAQYWVALSDFDSKYQDEPAYANDGRALRFVRIDIQPSGRFALYEGSTQELRRVKEVEQNPDKVLSLFEAYLGTVSGAATLAVYRLGAGKLTERGKVLDRFDSAVKRRDLGSASSALQEYARLVDGRKQTPLPPEIVQPDKQDTSAPIRDAGGDADNSGDTGIKIPWVGIAIGGAALLLLSSSRSQADDDY